MNRTKNKLSLITIQTSDKHDKTMDKPEGVVRTGGQKLTNLKWSNLFIFRR